jgi:hypothetical protein
VGNRSRNGAIIGAVVTVRLARRCLSPSSFRYSAFRGAAMLQATVAGGAVLALAATSLPLGVKVILGALIWLPLSFTLFRDIFLTVREPDQ